jgi:hypothetical protein
MQTATNDVSYHSIFFQLEDTIMVFSLKTLLKKLVESC